MVSDSEISIFKNKNRVSTNNKFFIKNIIRTHMDEFRNCNIGKAILRSTNQDNKLKMY
jgi:hypothetical protein